MAKLANVRAQMPGIAREQDMLIERAIRSVAPTDGRHN